MMKHPNFRKQLLRIGISFLFAMSLGIPNHSARASDDDGELTFCNFGPKVTVITRNAEHGKNPCDTKVRVQALHWKCGSPELVATTVRDYLDDLNKEAKQRCQEYCHSLGDQCRAIFTLSPTCGLSTDREDAIVLGKRLGCRKDCTDGKAFTYCSIYNTGYQGPNPEMVSQQKPNCECRAP